MQSQNQLNPKIFEQNKRDKRCNSDLVYTYIKDDTTIPEDYHGFLSNRKNKQLLVNYICEKFVQLGMDELENDQTLIIGGGFSKKGLAKIVK